MKLFPSVLSLLCGLVGAVPASLDRRQGFALDVGRRTKNELEQGSCKKITFVFTRASTEIGNMGVSMGPVVCTGLKKKYGQGEVACQGVGGQYEAALLDNVSSAGTTRAAIDEMIRLLNLAATKCPDTTIVAGGYSQGSALCMNAISTVPKDTKDRIVGVVLFGYTKNKQQSGGIPNYPKDQVKVFCTASDGVCGGTLAVTAGHFAYLFNGAGQEASNFLIQKIDAYLASWEYVEEEPTPKPKTKPKTTTAKPRPKAAAPPPPPIEEIPLEETPIEELVPRPKASPKMVTRPKISSPSKPKSTSKSSPPSPVEAPPLADDMSDMASIDGMEMGLTPTETLKSSSRPKPKSSPKPSSQPPMASASASDFPSMSMEGGIDISGIPAGMDVGGSAAPAETVPMESTTPSSAKEPASIKPRPRPSSSTAPLKISASAAPPRVSSPAEEPVQPGGLLPTTNPISETIPEIIEPAPEVVTEPPKPKISSPPRPKASTPAKSSPRPKSAQPKTTKPKIVAPPAGIDDTPPDTGTEGIPPEVTAEESPIEAPVPKPVPRKPRPTAAMSPWPTNSHMPDYLNELGATTIIENGSIGGGLFGGKRGPSIQG